MRQGHVIYGVKHSERPANTLPENESGSRLCLSSQSLGEIGGANVAEILKTRLFPMPGAGYLMHLLHHFVVAGG